MPTPAFRRSLLATSTLLLVSLAVAAPPARLPAPTAAESLTVKQETTATVSAAAANQSPENSSSGNAIDGKLQLVRIGADALEVPGASAIAGDYLLQNEKVTFVVNAPDHPNGNAATGGYIIDAFMNNRPVDRIAQLHLYLNDKYPRMARFNRAEVLSDGTTSDVVSLAMHGVDTEDPSIKVTSVYTLPKSSNGLFIETRVTPTAGPLKDFVLGDAFAWGQTQQFLPGEGLETVRRLKHPWVGGIARGVAYGYFSPETDTIFGPVGSTWADPNITTVTLQKGETGSFSRKFLVGHDLAEVTSQVFQEAGQKTVPIKGTVIEAEGGRGATGVKIAVSDASGKPVTEAVTQDGKFNADLPEGTYNFRAFDTVRSVLEGNTTLTISLDKPTSALAFRVASPAIVNFEITDADTGKPLPSRARLFGRDGTPDPDLGPAHETRTRNVIYIPHGTLRVEVPDGEYDLLLSRGIDYHATSIPISLKRNEVTTVKQSLKQAFNRDAALGGDFHLHMKNSFDSAVSLEDRVISCIGEGLQVLVATDHNYVTDLAPIVKRLGLQEWAHAIIGNEITTRKFMYGHFNAFPMEVKPTEPGAGATAYEGVVAAELFKSALAVPGEQVIQVNHPRAGDIGYFDRVHLNPLDGTTTHSNWSDLFTAIEIFNGKRSDQFEETRDDWFALLNIGYRFTATGNSDSHKVYEAEPGYPRNYVFMGSTQAPEAPLDVPTFVKAVNDDHAVVVTNGPFITVTADNNTSIGGSTTIKDGPVKLRVSVLGPNFVQPNEVILFANGKRVRAEKFAETSAPLKWEGVLEDDPTTDTWYVVEVRGDKSLQPILTPFKEGVVELDPTPLAITNPIWVDRNGDGKFTALHQEHYDEMHKDRSAEALSKIDELTTQSQQRNLFSRRRRVPGES